MSADFPYECAHCGHGELSATSHSGCSNCGSQGAIIPRVRADAVFARPVMENIDPLLSEYNTRKTGTLMNQPLPPVPTAPLVVTDLVIVHTLYSHEYRFTAKRSFEQATMQIESSGIPEDVRAELIAWLQS